MNKTQTQLPVNEDKTNDTLQCCVAQTLSTFLSVTVSCSRENELDISGCKLTSVMCKFLGIKFDML